MEGGWGKLTSKLSSDEGLQVLKDVLSNSLFQFIWGEVSWKGNGPHRQTLDFK